MINNKKNLLYFSFYAFAFALVCNLNAGVGYAQSASLPKGLAAKKILLANQIKKAESRIATLKDKSIDLSKELAALRDVQKQLQKRHDERGISGESFGEVIKTLQAKRVDLMIDIAGLNARRQTVMELKEEMGKGSKELLTQLSDLLKIEEDRLARVEALYQKGAAPVSDLQKGKARVLEVRIRLAEANQPAKSSSMLTDQLLNSSLERAEKQARLEKTESLLATFTSTRKSLDEARNTQRKIVFAAAKVDQNAAIMSAAKADLESLKAQLIQLESDLKGINDDN